MSHLTEWARRHAAGSAHGSALTDLLDGLTDADIAARRGLPRSTVAGLRSFYDQIDRRVRVCCGTACHFAGTASVAAALGPGAGEVRCLGHCYAAPAVMDGRTVRAGVAMAGAGPVLAGAFAGEGALPIPRRSLIDPPVVLEGLIGPTPCPDSGLREYELPDAARIIAAVEASGLRGRGGAAFPTAAKWRAARETPADARYVVANGDEGDPGAYIDRLLLEERPHAVLAGMLACGRAIGARAGIVYVRAEYPRAQTAVRRAIAQARAAGCLGDEFDVEVVPGAGSYVVGEETALLNSIEGSRGEPRVRPPYPAQAGLHGRPTVVQNIETLAIVPGVVRTGRGGASKAVCVSGAVARPGVVEIELGTPLSRVLHEGASGPAPGCRWRMALVGGPMGRVLPESAFDTPLSYEALPGMGHAGVVVLDDRVPPRELAEHLFAFAQAESCGTCTPCRVGTARLAQVRDRAAFERLLETLETGSLCGFGQGVPRPLRDLLRHFGDEVLE